MLLFPTIDTWLLQISDELYFDDATALVAYKLPDCDWEDSKKHPTHKINFIEHAQ